MTTLKRRDGPEPTIDQEQHMVLRLPRQAADLLTHDIEGAINLKDKLSVELKPDHRHSVVRYAGQVYQGRIVDLPCIIETLKTTDRKTFYKAADICQMMICSQGELSPTSAPGTATVAKDQSGKNHDPLPEKQYLYNHGLTRPLKNVRKRRFRKTMKKKYADMPDIEKDVKQLLRVDLEATKVTCTVVYDKEDDPHPTVTATNNSDVQPVGLPEDSVSSPKDIKDSANLISIAAAEIFGDMSSDSEEESSVNQGQEDHHHRHHRHHEVNIDHGIQGDDDETEGGKMEHLDNVLDSAVAEAGLDLQSQFFVDQGDISTDREYDLRTHGQFVQCEDDFELSLKTEDDGDGEEEVERLSLEEDPVLAEKIRRIDQSMSTLRARISIAEEEYASSSGAAEEDERKLGPYMARSIQEMKTELAELVDIREGLTGASSS